MRLCVSGPETTNKSHRLKLPTGGCISQALRLCLLISEDDLVFLMGRWHVKFEQKFKDKSAQSFAIRKNYMDK